LPLAFLLASTTVVLLIARLRFAGEALRFAGPVAVPAWAWDVLLVLLAAGAVVAAVRDRAALARPGARRALRELGVSPLGLALVWGALPPYRWLYRPWHYGLVAVFALLVVALFWRDRGSRGRWGITCTNFRAACRDLAAPTALLLAAGLAFAALGGFALRWDRLAVNLLTYPLYGFLQLLVLQVFLIRRLERLTDSRRTVALVAAGIFALVHWPNAVLLVGCLAAGAVWARNFVRYGNLLPIALSMGILAAVLMNVMPRERLRNGRCGPVYVYRELRQARMLPSAPLAAPPPEAPPSK